MTAFYSIKKEVIRKTAWIWTFINFMCAVSIGLIVKLYPGPILAKKSFLLAVLLIGIGFVINILQWLFVFTKKQEIPFRIKNELLIKLIQAILLEVPVGCAGLLLVIPHLFVPSTYIVLFPILLSLAAISLLLDWAIIKSTQIRLIQSNLNIPDERKCVAYFIGGIILSGLISILISEKIINLATDVFPSFLTHPKVIFAIRLVLPFILFNLWIFIASIISSRYLSWIKPGQSVKLPRIITLPVTVASVVTIFYFLFIRFFFTIGYGSYDDPFFLNTITGYLGGTPAPYLTHMSSALGYLLKPLFQTYPGINWITVLCYGCSVISVWILVYLACLGTENSAHRFFTIAIILFFNLYFIVNITYTISAALITFAGCCILIYTNYRSTKAASWFFRIAGIGCIVIGSFVRFQSAILISAFSFCFLPFIYKSIQIKRTLITLCITAILVAGGYALDKAYIQASPDWAAYTTYNTIRVSIHDTPRITNLESEIERVNWSDNDLLAFANWFFPDQDVYSLDHLKILSENTSFLRKDVFEFLYQHFIDPISQPYVVLNILCILFILKESPIKKNIILLFLNILATLSLLFIVSWILKLPFRVMFPILACAAILSLFINTWEGGSVSSNAIHFQSDGKFSRTLLKISLYCTFVLAFLMVNGQMWNTSRNFLYRQQGYQQVLEDLNSLRDEGILANHALIVGPGLGIPLHWADPFTVNLPEVQYLPMGWTTYSPLYQRVLNQFGISSLSQAIYQNDNVYIMTRSDVVPIIIQYEYEHHGVKLEANILYTIEENNGDPEYADMHLYQLVRK